MYTAAGVEVDSNGYLSNGVRLAFYHELKKLVVSTHDS